MPDVLQKLGVSEQTCDRWEREYGGLRTDQAKRLKDLEKEKARLKRLLADAALDKAILREVAEGCSRRAQLKFRARLAQGERLRGELQRQARNELLKRESFDTLLEAKVLIERWRQVYNTVRPHRAGLSEGESLP